MNRKYYGGWVVFLFQIFHKLLKNLKENVPHTCIPSGIVEL